MAIFSVLIPTAAPTGMLAEAAGAFVKIDGRECILRAVELFLNRDNVKQIQTVFVQDAVEDAKKKFGPHFGFSGVKILTGGPRWVDQLAIAADKISAEATHVIIHDGARPAVPYSDIDCLMEEAPKHEMLALSTPVRAQIVEVDHGAAVAVHSPDRYEMMLTPVVLKKEKFLELAKKKAEPHGSEWKLIKGSPLNIRVGGPGDEKMAKCMLGMLPKKKVQASSPFEEAQW